ncbi:MAG: protein jag [Streptococcaceae bacterium]|jgi:spoIIIJ-associated protein|nr:protein jag [Streptococcaceae bacterium]
MATYTGNTVEEAIERGLKREGIARENAHIEIEQRESNGFLGVGRKRARVSIDPIREETKRRADRMATRNVDQSDMEIDKAESAMEATLRLNKVIKAVRKAGINDDYNLTDEEKQEKIEKITQTVKAEPIEEIIPVSNHKTAEEPADHEGLTEEELIALVSDYLTKIIDGMGIKVKIACKKVGEVLNFNLQSNHDALLIGKHGKILDALDTLTKALASVSSPNRIEVRVNVGDYHEKRERYLISLANRAADRVISSGEAVYISDLPSHERKIIHNTLSNISGVSSHSEGQGTKRYIVVSPE